jgi:hypothetical protein
VECPVCGEDADGYTFPECEGTIDDDTWMVEVYVYRHKKNSPRDRYHWTYRRAKKITSCIQLYRLI